MAPESGIANGSSVKVSITKDYHAIPSKHSGRLLLCEGITGIMLFRNISWNYLNVCFTTLGKKSLPHGR